MSKHTPEPWVVDMESSGSGDICPKSEFDLSICEVQRADYSAETGRYFDGQTTEANRRLIAAAPELLEALTEIHLSFGGGNIVTFDDEAMARIAAVITKATA